MSPYRWTLHPADPAVVANLARSLNDLPEPLARALVLRGIRTFDEAKHFFRPQLAGTHDPFLMRDMDRAADRIAKAVADRERVLVYGDYDVDGTTATATMTLFLRALGVDADFFVPNRFKHGYGLCRAGLDVAAARSAQLVIALDCGITGVAEAAYARDIGLDLIIADHHKAGPVLPDAVAVLDPKRDDCPYPFDGLSGCGVGFKLAEAVLSRLGLGPERAHEALDLLAVSIASDIVPILDENRVLMRAGMERLASSPRPGLQALADIAGVDFATCSTSRLVFQIGPRINAAGRMGDAGLAVELLMEADPLRARQLAQELEGINRQRQTLDREITQHAYEQAERLMASDPNVLVLHDAEWHPGVIGIVASRIVERFHRPAIMLAGPGPVVKGSARSIPGLSIYDALAACGDVLEGFGGHAAAAGVQVALEHLEAFRETLGAAVGRRVEPHAFEPEIRLDAALHLSALDGTLEGRFWKVLRQFAPFGPDNLRPVFWGRNLVLLDRPRRVGQDGGHLKLTLAQREGGGVFHAIGFGLGDRAEVAEASIREGRPLEAAFAVDENHYNGRTSLQLQLKDIRLDAPAGDGATAPTAA